MVHTYETHYPFEAGFAMTFPSDESPYQKSRQWWSGWKSHWWPADIIRPGLLFYGFSTKSRRFCALLKVTKGGSFTYQSRKEFEQKVKKLIGRKPSQDDPHFSKIPFGTHGKPYTGYAFRWKVIKKVDIPYQHRFHQIGWEMLACNILQELYEFERANKHLKETMRRRLVDSRLGQGDFREKVLSYWKGCAITGCEVRELLNASHIKPWRKCNNYERLDPGNGLALIPNLHAAFDQRLISFRDNGRILISSNLDKETLSTLGINSKMQIQHLTTRHLPYLKYHREEVFRE